MADYPINRTPEHLRCPVGECPAVYELEGGKLQITGELISQQPGGGPLSQDEGTIVIDRELLSDLVQTDVSQADVPSGHLDFEAKAREIAGELTNINEVNDDLADEIIEGNVRLIASALSEAYEAGRNAERSRVKAAVVCEAFWRHRGVTPDENTQSPDAIVAQDLTYDRRLLEYLCDELAEPIEPLADIQINAVRRQLAAIRKRGSQVTAPKSQGEFETKSIIDHPYYNPRTSDDER